jgi:hypothetical protein
MAKDVGRREKTQGEGGGGGYGEEIGSDPATWGDAGRNAGKVGWGHGLGFLGHHPRSSAYHPAVLASR